ncbi:MAG: heavy metal translocating P-type ATPase metal-binding domain-containing protein [Spirosomaceae bacterium]|nr:heavy metal translocating P-type ATPase metal-binding domain-containing protein [Spirosomataceae bacterium]
MSQPISSTTSTHCYHCGADCEDTIIKHDDKPFCCEGCKTVYTLLQDNQLCNYYDLEKNPGLSPKSNFYAGKYAYLDQTDIRTQLIEFTDGTQTHVNWLLPQMHCSSCVYLLENLHRLHAGVRSSSVNFPEKKVRVVIEENAIKLSELAELLARIGYEPYLSLQDAEQAPKTSPNRARIYKIGVSGFAFGNIMMMSFPEYFGLGDLGNDPQLRLFFNAFNVLLALPVFFYGASDFFVSAWKSIRERYLNIDAPIALAILVTFARSLYEISMQTGAGYLDSMTGIVFFMLVGRYFQDKTYSAISFDRDYKSYFPVAVTLLERKTESVAATETAQKQILVSDLLPGDKILIRHKELIPADARLISERAMIDYSFVSGESAPVEKTRNESIYAGGRQIGGAIELEITKKVSQSYLTQLWNNDAFVQKNKQKEGEMVNTINRYFTWIVLGLGVLALAYWGLTGDLPRGINAITTILIVACPCALLLSDTFTNGNILGLFGRYKFYLKNARVIENLAKINTVVFDKTGTLTLPDAGEVKFVGKTLTGFEKDIVFSLTSQSSHPLSKLITKSLVGAMKEELVQHFKEVEGKGLEAYLGDDCVIRIGAGQWVSETPQEFQTLAGEASRVYYRFGEDVLGYFEIRNRYRPDLHATIVALQQKNYQTYLLSGDHTTDVAYLGQLFGRNRLFFNQKPEDKLKFIESLQQQGHQVMMIGDGLNDAGALVQSDVGVAVSDNLNNFSPACDGILDGSHLTQLPQYIRLARAGRRIVVQSFVISLVYNVIGLSFALTGTLSPVVAAILMPASSISIVLFTTLASRWAAWRIVPKGIQ